MKKIKFCLGYLMFCLCACIAFPLSVRADTIYDSPYVSFSPDGKGWTVQAGDTDYEHYRLGTTINTDIASALPAKGIGEHYYETERVGSIPIGKWVVNHRFAQCIHEVHIQDNDYLGLTYGRENCYQYYHSGWMAYCADCGEKIKNANIYMSREAAATIDYLECGVGLQYYYLCPYQECNNLEQGIPMEAHICKGISWNQYKIEYNDNDSNLPWRVDGFMSDSIHMYNNATTYEGNPVLPATKLMRCTLSCIGYEFVGWNTEPDGSGTHYPDQAEVLNLTPYDYNIDGELGVVTLYAQWKRSRSTLNIDANGGTYHGQNVYQITQDYTTSYTVDNSSVIAPEGYAVSFDTNGGSAVTPITGTQHFVEWLKMSPFKGKFAGDVYYFLASDGNVDTLRADYDLDSITLPETTKPNASFGGWYFDEEFTKPAGAVGDKLTPTKDMTLYAQWVELTLYSEDNYIANNRKGAVDLWWEQPDNKNKAYKLYQSKDLKTWLPVHSAQDIGNELEVSETFSTPVTNQTYTVPYTGLYTLTAYGAQGENYDTYSGGKGGMVSGTFWLTKGDVLTYSIGGQDGTGGGGVADSYGNGGGRTIVSSKEKGVLLIAGGGGGAGTLDGKPGGSQANLRTDGSSSGQAGVAGGGAGYVGGNNGE